MLVSRNVPQWWFYNSKSSFIRQFQKSSATCSDCLLWNLLALFQLVVFAKTGWPWIDGLRFLHPFAHFNYPSVQAETNYGSFNHQLQEPYRCHTKKPRKQNTSSDFWYCKKTTSQKASFAMDSGHDEPVFIFPENTSIEVLGLMTEGLSRHTRISKHILNVSISHHHVVRWFYRSLNPMLGIMTNILKEI